MTGSSAESRNPALRDSGYNAATIPKAQLSAPAPASERGFDARHAAILAGVAAVIVYLGSLQFGFVYDDRLQILNNPWMQSWRYLPRYFTAHLWAFSRPTAVGFWWRPLHALWMRLNYWAFGPHPMPWHVTTLALHVAATIMVFGFARRLSGRLGVATIAALIFAVHPAMIETAAWISGVPDSISVILLLAALMLYMRGRIAGAVVLYALALLVKESGVVFPALLAAYEWIFRDDPARPRRTRGQWIGAAAAFVLVTVVYLAARQHVLKGFTRPADAATALRDLLTAPVLLLWYLRMLVAPWPISVHYDNQLVTGVGWASVGLPLLLVIALVAAVVAWWRRSGDSQRVRATKFAIVWCALFLVPPLYLPSVTRADFAHIRYLYLAICGFSVVAGAAIAKLGTGRTWRGVSLRQATVVAAVVLALAAVNLDQQVYWANDMVLFAHGAQVAPHNAAALTDFGVELGNHGRLESALPVLEDAVRQDANSWYAVASLAYTEYVLNRNAEAEAHFRKSVQLMPGPVEQYLYLGIVSSRLKKYDESEWALREAIRRQPQTPRYHMALALVLQQEGKLAEAAEAARQELQIDPAAEDARQLLARLTAR